MNIDHTNLLKALKKDEPKEPTDAEKCEVANELHDWLTGNKQDSNEKSRYA